MRSLWEGALLIWSTVPTWMHDLLKAPNITSWRMVNIAKHNAHATDRRRNDVWGARDAGVHAWLWGADVRSFDELAYRGARVGA